jgi:hypothetical protein
LQSPGATTVAHQTRLEYGVAEAARPYWAALTKNARLRYMSQFTPSQRILFFVEASGTVPTSAFFTLSG